MTDPMIPGLFRSLVARAGGVDAAAAAIEARWGSCSKSHVSRMVNANAGVTIEAMIALQDFTGATPLTDYLCDQRDTARTAAGDIVTLAGQAARSAGSAQAALFEGLDPGSDGGVDLTPQEAAKIAAEMRRLHETVSGILEVVEGAPFIRGGQS